MQLVWAEGEQRTVESVEALDQALDELAAEAESNHPFMVELVSSKNGSLSIGVGRQESILDHVPASHDPPYFASVGDRSAEGTTSFLYMGDFSEFPRWSAVPVEEAREAMRRFLQNPKGLPANIEWTEV